MWIVECAAKQKWGYERCRYFRSRDTNSYNVIGQSLLPHLCLRNKLISFKILLLEGQKSYRKTENVPCVTQTLRLLLFSLIFSIADFNAPTFQFQMHYHAEEVSGTADMKINDIRSPHLILSSARSRYPSFSTSIWSTQDPHSLIIKIKEFSIFFLNSRKLLFFFNTFTIILKKKRNVLELQYTFNVFYVTVNC